MADPFRQAAATIALAVATGMTWFCPCDKLGECHFWPIMITAGIGIAIIVYENKFII
jgi:hypothetical protein